MVDSFRTFLNEHGARHSLSRLATHVHDHAVGMITASRNEYNKNPDSEGRTNKRRNAALAKDIRSHGFGFIHVRGRYVENHGTPEEHPVDEHSFLITTAKEHANELRKFLTVHGEKYGQDSVLYKHPANPHATLIGTKEGAFPGKGQEHDLGSFHANRTPEFHTVLTRGGPRKSVGHGKIPADRRTFAFEEFGLYYPASFSSRTETPF